MNSDSFRQSKVKALEALDEIVLLMTNLSGEAAEIIRSGSTVTSRPVDNGQLTDLRRILEVWISLHESLAASSNFLDDSDFAGLLDSLHPGEMDRLISYQTSELATCNELVENLNSELVALKEQVQNQEDELRRTTCRLEDLRECSSTRSVEPLTNELKDMYDEWVTLYMNLEFVNYKLAKSRESKVSFFRDSD